MVPSEQNILSLRSLPCIVAAVVIAAALFSCSGEEKRYVPNSEGGDITPTMATTDVSTLISDSGYTRYHLVAPIWQMFEDAEEPFWRFPEGLELEQYDEQMNPAANVVADSAIYYSRKKLWQLDGNVMMVNTQADSFLTQQVFWDQGERKIYTDSFIHIVRTDRTIEGYGMVSDQNMLYYTVNRPTAILPGDMRPGRKDSTKTVASPDTVAKPAPPKASSAKPGPEVEAIADPLPALEMKQPAPTPKKSLKQKKNKQI